MRTILLLMLLLSVCGTALATERGEPTVYVIQKGDTLWGLSQKFLKDPYYWPDLWSRNQTITNPHQIEPGQKLKVYPDRIELEQEVGEKPVPPPEEKVAEKAPIEEEPKDVSFVVQAGWEGFLLEKTLKPTGSIIATYQNRQMVGEDDVVYVDLGRKDGVRPGDRFSIFKKMAPISHPVTNIILGNKIIPLGTLQISEVEETVSKAIITESFMEIGAASYLTPVRERRRNIPLKAASLDLDGYIVETQTGNELIASGDVVFVDMGRKQGIDAGNLLYVVRSVEPNQKFIEMPVGKLPDELIGALVILETGENTSTALVVKSIDTIYRGNRVELRKSR